jgi:hypothetical protein
MDGKHIMVIFGLFMLGFFSKDIIIPVCDITEDVVDDLDDDIEHIIQEQKRKQHLLLLFLGLLFFGYLLMTMNRNEQSGGTRKWFNTGDDDDLQILMGDGPLAW